MVGDNFITGCFIISTPNKIFKWWYHKECAESGMCYGCETREI